MSLELAIKHALLNPIKARGRTSMPRLAAVLSDGRSTVVGYNSYKTHPLQARFGTDEHKVHIHAEISAISRGARRRLRFRDCTLYVARVTADGRVSNATPCEGCMAAIVSFGIKKLQYTE